MTIFKMLPALQTYDWGRSGSCWVRHLSLNRAPAEATCAEVWYGDHPSGPADVQLGDQRVSVPQLLQERGVEVLGDTRASMPFLAKVLSIGAIPLSIQMHPRAADAQRLHREKPDVFRDPYPKDEASVALETTELLYGFRRQRDILATFETLPELGTFFKGISAELPEPAFNEALCRRLFLASDTDITQVCEGICSRLALRGGSTLSPVEGWALRLIEHYTEGDVGLLFLFLLNYVRLEPGQALAIPAGRVHAYLSGELLEVMKPSDNVIRCGITTKKKDPTEMLRCSEFEAVDPTQLIQRADSGSKTESGALYRFHNDAFSVRYFDGKAALDLASGRAAVLVSLDAEGSIDMAGIQQEFHPADAFLIPAASAVKLSVRRGRAALFSDGVSQAR